LSICAVAQVIASSAGCISVDTGLSHITAALNRPNVTLFGPTDPGLVGGYGENQVALEARKQAQVEVEVEPKVFASLSPCTVWGRCSF
ncbi:MAG: glycosyltransferase family 9 protein, partial [Pseudomonadales bacterium]